MQGERRLGLSFVASAGFLLCANSWAKETNSMEGLWGFLNASVGGQFLSTSYGTESNKKGFAYSLSPKLSYYATDMVYDASVGYYVSKIVGNDARETTINTQSGIFDIAARFKVSPEFSMGPSVEFGFGSDNSYAEFVDGDSPFAAFLGANLMLDVSSQPNFAFRTGLNLLTDINIADRQLWMAMLQFEIGFPLSAKETSKEPEREPEPEEVLPQENLIEDIAPLPPPQPETVATVISETAVLVRLPNDKFLFDTGMSHLNPDKKAYVVEVGAFLGGNPSLWERVEVTGHTDVRGSRQVNEELSEARAKSVYNALREGGAAGEKMTYAGKAFDEPIDPSNTPEAWSQNRRTELRFLGVNDPESFSRVINELDSKYR